MNQSISALIVDDSATVRQVLSQILSDDPAFGQVQTAHDAIFAARKMKAHWPDVIILDIELPRKNGLTFLREIMTTRPTPVVVCSAFTQSGADLTVKALEAGAVECISKPKLAVKNFLDEYALPLCAKIKAAAQARVRLKGPTISTPYAQPGSSSSLGGPFGRPSAQAPGHYLAPGGPVVAIGASTGGTSAIEQVLHRCPADGPPILVAQHMPAGFTHAFAGRLNQLCPQTVKEAEHGEGLRYGHVYIGYGDSHITLAQTNDQLCIHLDNGPKVNRHRPSVDMLFSSVAAYESGHRLGILLTGMGVDGAKGLLAMRSSGALTICQDEASCVVYGMPFAAVKIGAAIKIVALSDIGDEVSAFAAAAKALS